MPAVAVAVAVVGAGPVGQLLAVLLGSRGHDVVVLERRAAPYPLPRAVAFDDEIARLLAAAGVLHRVPVERADSYQWRTASGEVLLHFDWSAPGPAGYPTANMFAQPELESALEQRLAELPSVHVVRDRRVVGIRQDGAGADLHAVDGAGGEHHIRARYVVGADGAESTVRELLDIHVTDLGFAHDWLIADVRLHEPRLFDPVNLQLCDPARPTTQVSGGPGRRRWEFMRLPGEDAGQLGSAATTWRLLAPFGVHPGSATLERRAVYTFRARWADAWRVGRVFLAGDAAHLMPPFAGQGLCSGFRDAANLAWKLDRVLAGTSGDALLDSYTSERGAHVQHAVHLSVELGKVICLLDPPAAAARDAGLLRFGGDPARALPPAPPPRLGAGCLRPGPGSGLVTPQGRVTLGGRSGLLDDVVGPGFRLLVTDGPPDPARSAALDGLGVRVLAVGEGGLRDDDGVLTRWLADLGAVAALVRPDTYLFGTAATPAELPGLVDDLVAVLAGPEAPR